MKEPAEKITDLVAEHRDRPGGLLPLLHAIQDEIGYIPPESVEIIAKALSLSGAEVHGVISFYHHFRTEPASGPLVQICCAEACRSMGAEKLFEHAKAVCEAHPVYCLGLCATSPAIMIGDALHARVTQERFDELLKKAAS